MSKISEQAGQTVDVDLDFSQFQITSRPEPGDRRRYGGSSSVGLARSAASGQVWMLAPRQHGRVPIGVFILPRMPELDDGWDEVVEIPFHCTGETVLHGYDASMGTTALALTAGHDYRLRYSIANIATTDFSADPESYPPPESYRLQFWPDDVSDSKVCVSRTTWGQFVHFDFALELTAQESAALPPEERLPAYVARAILAYPGGREAIDSPEMLLRLISRYARQVKVGGEGTDLAELVAQRLQR